MQALNSRTTSVRCQALFGKGKGAAGTKAVGKKAGTKKAAPKAASRPEPEDRLWLPNTERPEWLDGSLPGDRGFDPLGLSRPDDYVQIGVDEEDQNLAQNLKGSVEAIFTPDREEVSSNALAPYADAFGLQRFRENELIHGRWAMLGVLGSLVGEAATGVSWVDAGKVELDGASYLGQPLPFTITQLIWIEAILVGGAEVYRNNELDPERRLYPGGAFDPFNLSDGQDDEKIFRLREAEIKHARLAMVAFLGFGIQAAATGEGALGALAKFAGTL